MTDSCQCPEPELCTRLGWHLRGRTWQIWHGINVDPAVAQRYRQAWCDAAGLVAPDPAAVTIVGQSVGTDGLPKRKPVAEWPRLARWCYFRRRPDERGVGDTVARKLGAAGEILKRVFKRLTGRDCGCGDRQAALNHLYPYPKS